MKGVGDGVEGAEHLVEPWPLVAGRTTQPGDHDLRDRIDEDTLAEGTGGEDGPVRVAMVDVPLRTVAVVRHQGGHGTGVPGGAVAARTQVGDPGFRDDPAAPDHPAQAVQFAEAGEIAQGDVKGAAEMLGHWWVVAGEVVGGFKKGTGMGFPTANVVLPRSTPLAYGIYIFMQTAAGRGAGAALGMIAVVIVGLAMYVSQRIIERGTAAHSMAKI